MASAKKIRADGFGRSREYLSQFVAEVAAQLAELNESRKPRWVELSLDGLPVILDANQISGIQVSGRNKNGVEKYLSIGMRGGAWSKTVDGPLTEVMAKLGIEVKK